MSLEDVSGLYAVAFDTTVLGGITQQKITTGVQTRGEAASGELYPRLQSITGQQPGAEFTTVDIAAAIDNAPLTGAAISDLTAGLSFFAQAHQDEGARSAGSTHRKYNIVQGIVYPRSLSVDHQGDATISFAVIATSTDGAIAPIIETDTQALPAIVTNDIAFTLGGQTIGGVALTGVRNLTIDFGITAAAEGADSDIFPTKCSIRSVATRLTYRGINTQWLKSSNIPITGQPATHANTVCYLRKRAAGGSYVADITAEHIKMTAAGICVVEDAFDASGAELAECSLAFPLLFDGTNAPLTVDTASAIT